MESTPHLLVCSVRTMREFQFQNTVQRETKFSAAVGSIDCTNSYTHIHKKLRDDTVLRDWLPPKGNEFQTKEICSCHGIMSKCVQGYPSRVARIPHRIMVRASKEGYNWVLRLCSLEIAHARCLLFCQISDVTSLYVRREKNTALYR